MLISCIAFTIIGFFSGSLMFSYFIPKLVKNIDVRELPGCDGNPGSSNAIRAVGIPLGMFCMALDVLKAFIPVFAALTLAGLRGFYLVPVIVSPVFGHAFSPFLGFNGGKAISATYGALLAIMPISKFVFFVVIVMAFFRFVIIIRPDSNGVLVSMCAVIIASILFERLLFLKLALILISLTVIYKILKNPNTGELSVSIWHLSLTYEDKRLRLHKT